MNLKFHTESIDVQFDSVESKKFSYFYFKFCRHSRLRVSNGRTVGADAICRNTATTKGAKSVKSFDSCKYAACINCVKNGLETISGPPLTASYGFGLVQT